MSSCELLFLICSDLKAGSKPEIQNAAGKRQFLESWKKTRDNWLVYADERMHCSICKKHSSGLATFKGYTDTWTTKGSTNFRLGMLTCSRKQTCE